MRDKLQLDELYQEMRTEVVRRVAEGFDDADEIVYSVCDYLEDEDDQLRPHVERLTAELMQEYLRQQQEWPEGPTDCDRLDAAFNALEAEGIVARQNFSCCQNCGHAEIGDEIDEADFEADGYTFYHMQDTEGAVEGGDLLLAYGATAAGGAATRAVGERVAAALRAAGLEVEWNGSGSQRIRVLMQWRRRR